MSKKVASLYKEASAVKTREDMYSIFRIANEYIKTIGDTFRDDYIQIVSIATGNFALYS